MNPPAGDQSGVVFASGVHVNDLAVVVVLSVHDAFLTRLRCRVGSVTFHLCQQPSMDPLAKRVAFKYVPKEKKEHKVDRLAKVIRDATGLSRGTSEAIADAVVRGRNLEALALQKSWPVEDGTLTGPDGSLELSRLTEQS